MATVSNEQVRFEGRIFFLSEDADVVESQLRGTDLSLADALPLRSDVSTDEITPAWICYYYDEKLGEYPYLGLKCGQRTPVSAGSVKAGGFGVTVAGRRYGKGSSREASPYAEWCAGIRLVIAESFERIYRQNCRNLGIYTSTDFGLIERIRCGESIPVSEFTQGEDELNGRAHSSRRVVQAGARAKGRMVADHACHGTAADDLCRKDHRTRFRRQFRGGSRWGRNFRQRRIGATHMNM